jgi:hypothetical protein
MQALTCMTAGQHEWQSYSLLSTHAQSYACACACVLQVEQSHGGRGGGGGGVDRYSDRERRGGGHYGDRGDRGGKFLHHTSRLSWIDQHIYAILVKV